MLRRRQVVFRPTVTFAGFADLADGIDAQTAHHVLGPAATVAVARQSLLGGKHPVAAIRGDVTQKIRLIAEQPKPALNLPDDLRAWRCRIGLRPGPRPPKSQA